MSRTASTRLLSAVVRTRSIRTTSARKRPRTIRLKSKAAGRAASACTLPRWAPEQRSPTSTTSSSNASTKPTPSTMPRCRRCWMRTNAVWRGRRLAACCGPSSTTRSTSRAGSPSTAWTRSEPMDARRTFGMRSGRTWSATTSSPCPTSGSTRGTRRGTSHSMPLHLPPSTSTSPSNSCDFSCATSTCIPMGNCRPTSGPSTM